MAQELISLWLQSATVELIRQENEWGEDMLMAAYLARMPVSHVEYHDDVSSQTMLIVLEGGHVWARRTIHYVSHSQH